jgi:hypothetical protein
VFGSYLREYKAAKRSVTPISRAIGKKKRQQQAETAVDIDDYIQRIEQEIGRK